MLEELRLGSSSPFFTDPLNTQGRFPPVSAKQLLPRFEVEQLSVDLPTTLLQLTNPECYLLLRSGDALSF